VSDTLIQYIFKVFTFNCNKHFVLLGYHFHCLPVKHTVDCWLKNFIVWSPTVTVYEWRKLSMNERVSDTFIILLRLFNPVGFSKKVTTLQHVEKWISCVCGCTETVIFWPTLYWTMLYIPESMHNSVVVTTVYTDKHWTTEIYVRWNRILVL
jgi:hypothetical protein